MLVIIIFITWAWKAVSLYSVAKMAKNERKSENTLKKMNVIFAITKLRLH